MCYYDKNNDCTNKITNSIGLNIIYFETTIDLISLIKLYICELLYFIFLKSNNNEIKQIINKFFYNEKYNLIETHDGDMNIKTKKFFSYALKLIFMPFVILSDIKSFFWNLENPSGSITDKDTMSGLVWNLTDLNRNNKLKQNINNLKSIQR